MKALALFSGGLDSMLAVKLLVDQGIDVIALHIDIGFNSKKENHVILRERASLAGATLEIIDVHDDYLQKVLFAPKYGYGKQFNPCIDCHGYMFRLAKGLLARFDASFIATGEVVGQRPMSQTKEALRNVKRLANDLEDNLIVRPLSAKLMEESTPEKEGWVDRAKFLDLNGRGRKGQLALAREFGWEDYPSPAGGCLLADIQFSERIRDLLAHEPFESSDTLILKNGRHFRLPEGSKLVLGRNQAENDFLEQVETHKFIRLHVADFNAPSGLLSNNASEKETLEACRILLTFTKADANTYYDVKAATRFIRTQAYPSRDDVRGYLI
jgi:tRNA-uridine 2-sulfurtransferase